MYLLYLSLKILIYQYKYIYIYIYKCFFYLYRFHYIYTYIHVILYVIIVFIYIYIYIYIYYQTTIAFNLFYSWMMYYNRYKNGAGGWHQTINIVIIRRPHRGKRLWKSFRGVPPFVPLLSDLGLLYPPPTHPTLLPYAFAVDEHKFTYFPHLCF